jgi:hypothetical protein
VNTTGRYLFLFPYLFSQASREPAQTSFPHPRCSGKFCGSRTKAAHARFSRRRPSTEPPRLGSFEVGHINHPAGLCLGRLGSIRIMAGFLRLDRRIGRWLLRTRCWSSRGGRCGCRGGRRGRTDLGSAVALGGMRLDRVQFHAVAHQLANQVSLGLDDTVLFHHQKGKKGKNCEQRDQDQPALDWRSVRSGYRLQCFHGGTPFPGRPDRVLSKVQMQVQP